MIVLKFGGTSVADAIRVRRAANIIAFQDGQKAVVVSAAAGITNLLIQARDQASTGELEAVDHTQTTIVERHRSLLDAIDSPDELTSTQTSLEMLHQELDRRLREIVSAGEATAKASDALVTIGEQAMCRVMAAVLRSEGCRATAISSSSVIATDDRHGNAKPDRQLTRERAEQVVRPLLDNGDIVVMTGFLGSAPDGSATTLGRSGSDYSATLLGAALQAEEIQIWTDVPGVLSADPKLIPSPRVVPQISFDEAQELAHFGAKVLHPRTIRPAVALDIPVRILSTFAPEEHGTLVTRHWAGERPKAVTSLRNLLLLTVDVPELEDLSGAAAAVFGALHEDRVDVILASQGSSRRRMTYLIDCGDAGGCSAMRTRLQEALYEFEAEVGCVEDVAIVAAVGHGAAEQPRSLAHMLAELGRAGIPVLASSQQMSNAALVAAIPGEQADLAVLALHEAFLGLRTSTKTNRRKRRSAMISEAMQVG